MRGRAWTVIEVQFLKDHRDESNEYLAKKLGRTLEAVKSKKRVLDIKSGQTGLYMPEMLSEQEKLVRIYKLAAELGVRLGG